MIPIKYKIYKEANMYDILRKHISIKTENVIDPVIFIPLRIQMNNMLIPFIRIIINKINETNS